MARPSKWRYAPSDTIRIPKVFAACLEQIATAIDQGQAETARNRFEEMMAAYCPLPELDVDTETAPEPVTTTAAVYEFQAFRRQRTGNRDLEIEDDPIPEVVLAQAFQTEQTTTPAAQVNGELDSEPTPAAAVDTAVSELDSEPGVIGRLESEPETEPIAELTTASQSELESEPETGSEAELESEPEIELESEPAAPTRDTAPVDEVVAIDPVLAHFQHPVTIWIDDREADSDGVDQIETIATAACGQDSTSEAVSSVEVPPVEPGLCLTTTPQFDVSSSVIEPVIASERFVQNSINGDEPIVNVPIDDTTNLDAATPQFDVPSSVIERGEGRERFVQNPQTDTENVVPAAKDETPATVLKTAIVLLPPGLADLCQNCLPTKVAVLPTLELQPLSHQLPPPTVAAANMGLEPVSPVLSQNNGSVPTAAVPSTLPTTGHQLITPNGATPVVAVTATPVNQTAPSRYDAEAQTERAFADRLFQTWQQLATAQTGTGRAPWGVPVAIEALYRHGFRDCTMHRFLAVLGRVLVNPTLTQAHGELEASDLQQAQAVTLNEQPASHLTFWATGQARLAPVVVPVVSQTVANESLETSALQRARQERDQRLAERAQAQERKTAAARRTQKGVGQWIQQLRRRLT